MNTSKAIKALRRIEAGPAWERARAYIILSPDKQKHGRIQVAYPRDGAGTLHVFVWDCDGTPVQYGAASSCDYDKLSAALTGITFDNILFRAEPAYWKLDLKKAGYTVIQAL